jgi:flagellar basal-body rod protein FlgB
MDALFDKTINLLSNRLDYRSKRHTVVVSNIANIDTPGYKPSDVTFKDEFDKAGQLTLKKTHAKHIPPQDSNGSVNYEVTTSEENVKIDTEMANLAENNLMYNTTVEMLARKFRGLNTVLKETK